jgi:hypothetical protein
VVEHLTSKHEALSTNPSTKKTNKQTKTLVKKKKKTIICSKSYKIVIAENFNLVTSPWKMIKYILHNGKDQPKRKDTLL